MNLKKKDKHTPAYYYKQLHKVLETADEKTMSAVIYNLIYSFREDFQTLCPGPLSNWSQDHVRQVVDHLDAKYTETIRYFKKFGLCDGVPDMGYKESLLASHDAIAKAYGWKNS